MTSTPATEHDAPAPEPGEDSESASAEPGAESPTLVLELDGDRAVFASYREGNSFLLVKHLPGLQTPGMSTITAVTKLALGQVKPHEVARLEAYLERHGHSPDYSGVIWRALEATWNEETSLPLEQ